MHTLPKDFLEKMKPLLKEEYESFIKSYDEFKKQGLRINTLKIDPESFLHNIPFKLEPIPWTEVGFYHQEDKPGKHPYHEAGLYYIQEPSAMAVGEILDPQPGDKVLDLCAAPGGKSTHIAQKLQGQGLLVSNELYPLRAKILGQNIERMGIRNCVVTNEEPKKLSKKFKNYFDKILVDAPCSGEGMFRKDPDTIEEWSLENVEKCQERQQNILEEAQKMLKVEGRMVYSTCTFSPEENEAVIEKFLQEHKEFILEEVKHVEGFSQGREDFIGSINEDLRKTIRLWPHHLKGEGHFIAVLKKVDGKSTKPKKGKNKFDTKSIKDYYEFCKKYLNTTLEGNFTLFKDQLYLLPDDIKIGELKVVRAGLHLGTMKKNRFEPSHALALSMKIDEVKNHFELSSHDHKVIDYLRGQSMQIEGQNGWNLVTVDGYSIGWCKMVDGILKNHYPKGLRWMGSR